MLSLKTITRSALLLVALLVAVPASAQTVVHLPDFADPKGAEIVGVNFQNPTGNRIPEGPIQFGQAFVAGDLAGNSGVEIKLGGKTYEAQLDVKNRYPDGSVRFGVVSLIAPELAARSQNEAILAPASRTGTPVTLTSLPGYQFVVTLKTATKTHTFNIPALFATELAAGRVSFWRQGPIVTEGRIDIPVESSMRLVVDLAKYRDGTYTTDVAFRNDYAMTAQGGELTYDVTITQNGTTVFSQNALRHFQYTAWRKFFSTAGERPVNVQIDTRYVRETKAFQYYDIEMGLDKRVIDDMAAMRAKDANWRRPFSNNGIFRAMGTPGNRADIGPMTLWGASWIITQDPIVADVALAQGEAAAGIPWHMWDVANKTWLNLSNYPRVWTDPRGWPKGAPGDKNSGQLTQTTVIGMRSPGSYGWDKDEAHRPQLSFLPYLFTGVRFHLDELMASGHDHFMTLWPVSRVKWPNGSLLAQQVRGMAWALRDVAHAAWAAPDGTTEQAYLQEYLRRELQYQVSMIPARTAEQGSIYGYQVAPTACDARSVPGWQNDWVISSMGLIAGHGYPDAKKYIEWATNFSTGRFLSESKGMNPRDGILEGSFQVGYFPEKGCKGTFVHLTTWGQVGDRLRELGRTNPAPNWPQANGYYGRAVLLGLASIINSTGNNDARTAYNWVRAANPPFITPTHVRRQPQMAITLDPDMLSGTPAPLVSLAANPLSTTPKGTVSLTWSSAGTTRCDGSNFTVTDLSGTVTVRPDVTTTYTITCTGPGGTATRDVTVTVGGAAATTTPPVVTPPPPATPTRPATTTPNIPLSLDGAFITSTSGGALRTSSGVWSFGQNTTPFGTTILLNGQQARGASGVAIHVLQNGKAFHVNNRSMWYEWRNNAWVLLPRSPLSVNAPVTPVTPPTGNQSLSLVARPASVRSGDAVTLSWSSRNLSQCASSDFTVSANAAEGSATVRPTQTTTYRITCQSVDNKPVSAEARVTVSGTPVTDGGNPGTGNPPPVVSDPSLQRPVTRPASHAQGFAVMVGDTRVPLPGTVTVPVPTITNTPNAWVPRLEGTNGVDVFEAKNFGGNPTFVSGGGNDIVYMPGGTNFRVEGVGSGAQLLQVANYTSGFFGLLPNINNGIYIGTASDAGFRGNNADNILIAQPASVRGNGLSLNGMRGDDVLVLSQFRDLVVIDRDGGTDTILGFNTAATGGDVVRLYPNAFTSYRELASALRQDGPDTVLVLKNGEELWFMNTSATAFTPAHFARLSSDWSATGQVRGISTDLMSFVSRLSLRSSGEEVRLLQETLRSLGYYQAASTGFFGPQTEASVQQFQTEHGLPALGIVGPLTRLLLNGALQVP
jgi:hypothetical protein